MVWKLLPEWCWIITNSTLYVLCMYSSTSSLTRITAYVLHSTSKMSPRDFNMPHNLHHANRSSSYGLWSQVTVIGNDKIRKWTRITCIDMYLMTLRALGVLYLISQSLWTWIQLTKMLWYIDQLFYPEVREGSMLLKMSVYLYHTTQRHIARQYSYQRQRN